MVRYSLEPSVHTIGMSLAPGAGGSDLVLLASWEVTHVPLRSGANGSILVMQTPEIVFWQLERERDQLENSVDHVVVGVLGECLDLWQVWQYRLGMLSFGI